MDNKCSIEKAAIKSKIWLNHQLTHKLHKPIIKHFTKIWLNQQLTHKLHKPIIKHFTKNKLYSSSINNIWSADLGDMQLIRKYNKGIQFSLSVLDIYRKYTSAVPLKVIKNIAITKVFQKMLGDSNWKPNIIWVD